jgi:hypothetical protein
MPTVVLLVDAMERIGGGVIMEGDDVELSSEGSGTGAVG